MRRRDTKVPRKDCHVVDHGNVGCPVRQADVELDSCLWCAAFVDLVEHDDRVYLYCRGRPALATA